MEVIQVFDRPASQQFYAVAGRLLFVVSDNLQLCGLIERLFAGWQLAPIESSECSPDIRINFRCGEVAPEIPKNLIQFEIAEGGQCYLDGDGYHLALHQSLIQLQNGNPVTVNVWLDDLPAPGAPGLARAASFAVCAALRRYELFDLHSAGVVHPSSEKAVLIIGPSGSGKSTLALQLTLAGWPYLSDDELLLSLNGSEVEARGFRRFFAISNATATAIGLDSPPRVEWPNPANDNLKVCFSPELISDSPRRLRALPGFLLFTGLSDGPTTHLNRLTQAETMVRLIRACPWATYDTAVAGANLKVLARLARQAEAFDLFAGRDLLEPGYAADLLIRSLLHSSGNN